MTHSQDKDSISFKIKNNPIVADPQFVLTY